jgi:hypothetical protein
MNFERITAYQLENFFSHLAEIHMLKMTMHVSIPSGVYIDENKKIHMVSPIKKSLYEHLHCATEEELAKWTPFNKLTVLVQLA